LQPNSFSNLVDPFTAFLQAPLRRQTLVLDNERES
jgi:hypothetical protein